MAQNNMFMLREIRTHLGSAQSDEMYSKILPDDEAVIHLAREVCQLALSEIFGVSIKYDLGNHDKIVLHGTDYEPYDYDGRTDVHITFSGRPIPQEPKLTEIYNCILVLSIGIQHMQDIGKYKQLPVSENIRLPGMSADPERFRGNIAAFISHMVHNPMDICSVSMDDILAMSKIAKTYHKLESKSVVVKGGIASGLLLVGGVVVTAAKIITKKRNRK